MIQQALQKVENKSSLWFICDSSMLQILFLQHPHQVAVQLLLSVYRRNFRIQGKLNVRCLRGEHADWAWTSMKPVYSQSKVFPNLPAI